MWIIEEIIATIADFDDQTRSGKASWWDCGCVVVIVIAVILLVLGFM